MLAPERYADVSDWLEVDDFDGTTERLVYGVIDAANRRGEVAAADVVNRALIGRADAARLQAGAAFLHDCMQACPVPARASTYGRMVLESSIRRRVAAEGAGLRQAIEESGPTVCDLNHVFFKVDSVRREVERLHQREARADGVRSPTPLAIAELDSVPGRRQPRKVEIERSAVLALIDDPTALDRVLAWLRADDFTDPGCSATYQQLRTMPGRGEPVDRITVAWASLRGNALACITDRDNWIRQPGQPVNAIESCRGIVAQSVRARLLATALTLETMTDRRGAKDVTGAAYRRLNDTWPHLRRMVHAHRSA